MFITISLFTQFTFLLPVHFHHGHILILFLKLACMSFRWSVTGGLGGCNRLDAPHFCQGLCLLYHYRICKILAYGLSKYQRGNKNGY